MERHECRGCGESFPTDEMAAGSRRRDGTMRHTYCKGCKRQISRDYAARNRELLRQKSRAHYYAAMADPVRAERMRSQNREAKRRKALDPAEQERVREASRRYRAELRANPRTRAMVNRDRREARAKLKAEDPEGYEAMLARERAKYRRRMEDAERRRVVRENARMAYRMRKLRAGGELSDRRHAEGLRDERALRNVPSTMALPADALVAFIQRLISQIDSQEVDRPGEASAMTVCASLGIDDRSWRAWRNGERKTVRFEVADRVTTRVGLTLADVWSPEKYPEIHERLSA